MGIVSPFGSSLDRLWNNVVSAKSAIGPLTRFNTDALRIRVAGQIPDYQPGQHFQTKELDLLDRFSQLAIVAARSAAADSGIKTEGAEAFSTGASVGSGCGGAETYDASYYQLYAARSPRVHPLTIPRLMNNAATSQVCMYLGVKGPSLSISTACASATHAIGEAFRTIRAGAAEVMFTGGSDAPLTLGFFKSWEAMRVLASGNGDAASACRPFSVDREGLVISEGAAMLVLEEYEHARRRGARIYAEVLGYGASADSSHITQPSVEGPSRAIELALREAGISAGQVDYINAHGTGTKMNDATETRAIRQAFGSSAGDVSISSTKSMHGHLMGASGALELVITILALREAVVPPTAHYRGRDPECDLDYTPNEARSKNLHYALSNSFAFGGLNAVIAVARV
jgi:nodulation protein E